MKCIEAIEVMSDAMEGATGLLLDCHLAACRPCSHFLAQLRLTVELTARLREFSKPPAGFHRTLLDRV